MLEHGKILVRNPSIIYKHLCCLQSEEKIALDSYEVTIFPAESVNNTKIVQAKGDLKDSTYRYERERT